MASGARRASRPHQRVGRLTSQRGGQHGPLGHRVAPRGPRRQPDAPQRRAQQPQQPGELGRAAPLGRGARRAAAPLSRPAPEDVERQHGTARSGTPGRWRHGQVASGARRPRCECRQRPGRGRADRGAAERRPFVRLSIRPSARPLVCPPARLPARRAMAVGRSHARRACVDTQTRLHTLRSPEAPSSGGGGGASGRPCPQAPPQQ